MRPRRAPAARRRRPAGLRCTGCRWPRSPARASVHMRVPDELGGGQQVAPGVEHVGVAGQQRHGEQDDQGQPETAVLCLIGFSPSLCGAGPPMTGRPGPAVSLHGVVSLARRSGAASGRGSAAPRSGQSRTGPPARRRPVPRRWSPGCASSASRTWRWVRRRAPGGGGDELAFVHACTPSARCASPRRSFSSGCPVLGGCGRRASGCGSLGLRPGTVSGAWAAPAPASSPCAGRRASARRGRWPARPCPPWL